MNIIVSPAKTMVINNDWLASESTPIFIQEAKEIRNVLKDKSYDELKKLYKVSDKITQLNYDRFKSMSMDSNLSPAILSFKGLQYQYMGSDSFTREQFVYMQKHLIMLSGMYGFLRALDGIIPYRIELQSRLDMGNPNFLYGYWGDKIYKELIKSNRNFLNLASKEYSLAIEPYISEKDKFITCNFGEIIDGKVIMKATKLKMARGEMLRYLSEYNIDSFKGVKTFDRLNYKYSEEHSSEDIFVFVEQ